eukprot:SAG31_NODE_4808_length_2945_cov_2.155306_3_plen_65_part_00
MRRCGGGPSPCNTTLQEVCGTPRAVHPSAMEINQATFFLRTLAYCGITHAFVLYGLGRHDEDSI